MIIRSKIKMFAMIAVTLGVGIAAAAGAPVVPSHQLKGTYSAGTVEGDCINAGGQFFNAPNGGYGCAGPKGSVSCTSKGTCTGTCQACREAGPSGPGVGQPSGTGVVRPITPVHNVLALSLNAPGRQNIAGAIRLPVSSGSRPPASGGMIAAFAHGGFGKR